MKTHAFTMALAFAALGLGACSKKQPETIPPGAIGSEDGSGDQTAGGDGNVGTEAVPGSAEDFIRSVGMGGDRVFFETDEHDLDDRDRRTLDQQLAWLQRYPNVRITIEGHADERGTREYNLALGDRRANAAKNYLAARGVSSARMQVISWGKERPEAIGSDEGAWAQNRRAVTVIPR